MKLVGIEEEVEVTAVFRVQGTPQELATLKAAIQALVEGRGFLTNALIRVEDVDFSVRTSNCLRNMGIATIGLLLEKSGAELLAENRHFGKKSLSEVTQKLAELGLALKPETEQTAAPAPEAGEEENGREATNPQP